MKINNIASQASKLDKKLTTKKAVFYMLSDVMTRDQDTDNIRLSAGELAMLYRYFMPANPSKPKTPEEWVKLAMPIKDVRYYLNYVHSDGARIYASDGHRLHVYKTNKYPAGFYDSQMNPVECDGKYPDIDRVIPDSKSLPGMALINELEIKHYGKGYKSQKFENCYVVPGDGVAVDKAYLDKALMMDESAVIRYSDKKTSVYIESGDYQAVVMPVIL